jgi:hypothetical protein
MSLFATKGRLSRRQLVFWGGAFLLMVGGIVWFAVLPSTLSYWLGTSLAVPFVGLVANRANDKGFTSRDSDPYNDDGPWGAP